VEVARVAEQRLTILQLNDSHGYMDQHLEMFWSGGQATFAPAGGFSRIKRMADEIRAETDGRMLFFDCGDTIHGTHAEVQSKGEAVIRVANELGLDAWSGRERSRRLTPSPAPRTTGATSGSNARGGSRTRR